MAMRTWILIFLGLVASGAQAISVTTATYSGINELVSPSNPGGIESVGPFDTYDFAPGVVAINIDASGNVVGAFQSYLILHQLGSVSVPSTVNTNYELTVYGTFTGTSSTSGPVVNFSLTGGSYTVYLDDIIDHNFVGTGSGFTNGTAILVGTISAGAGSYIASPVNAGFSLVLSAFPTANSVFNPFPLAGESIFGLSLGSLPAGATGVGNIAAPSVLLGADGNLRFLRFVPEPAMIWLFSPVLASLVWQQRRRRDLCSDECGPKGGVIVKVSGR